MATWPPVLAEKLLARLALGDDEFEDYLAAVYAAIPARAFDADAYARATGYPWERPSGSYALRDGAVEPLAGLGADARTRLIRSFTEPAAGRSPLLAIGSNAAPAALARKLADLGAREDRSLLVLRGRLRDFDVGAAAHLAVYGSLPATLFPSPGTEVETATLWVTPVQFERLAWSEMSYGLGRLRAEFVADEGEGLDEVVAFVSRFGAFRVDGRPVALAAVPARGRTAPALTQERLLEAAAALVLGPGSTAEDLVRAMHEDPAETFARVALAVRPAGLRFEHEHWRPLGRDGGRGR